MLGNSNNIRIGFYYEDQAPYSKVMASTRLRCLDVINYFSGKADFFVESYKDSRHYSIVIFQKLFNQSAIKKAKQLHLAGSKVVLDINVNYIEDGAITSEYVTAAQQADMREMLAVADAVLVSSPNLLAVYSRFHDKVFCIEESVHESFFGVSKRHLDSDAVRFVYCGYSSKAKELCVLAPVLQELHQRHGVKMLYISEQDPKIDVIPYDYIQYDQERLPEQLVQGSIKLAPRDLCQPYNLGHTFTKVAYPMAVGLPAVASAVPAYQNREVLICSSRAEWLRTLARLVLDSHLRNYFGQRGRRLVKRNFSAEVIGEQYAAFFGFLSGGA
jgi:hypothetical protein